MTNSKHIPKRRFKEFELDDEWNLLKLDEVAKYRNGKAHENSISLQGKFIVVNSKFISTNGEVKKFTDLQIEPIFKNEISFVLSDVPNGRAIARTFLIDQNDKYTLNQRIAAITPNSNISPYYLYVLLNRNKYFLEFDDGVKQTNLSKADVLEFKEYYPISKEQSMIGNFFQTIDSLITLHQHKLDKLKDLKKAYLTEMFPAEGECVPKRRFPGFEGEWEHKKLGQLMDVGSVKRVHQSDWRDRGVRFLRARDIVSESKNKKPDDFLYIDEELYKKYSAISGMVEKGDLLVTGVGTIGVPMLVESSEPLYFKDGNIIWFKNKNLLDGHFFYYSFTARAIQKFIGDVAGVGTVGTYTIDSGKNTPILLPVTKEEQVVIGDFFKKLDQSISLQQQKLDKLNDLKKAYLNELFV